MGAIERELKGFLVPFMLRVDFQGARMTSNGGLVFVRELDDRLGLGELIVRHLSDPRGRHT